MIKPGGSKAVLTLADGKNIVLDGSGDGTLIIRDGLAVLNTKGKLSYQKSHISKTKETGYNSVKTPRGGQYHIELADGTKVWLNAASSLRFPPALEEDHRLVELTGEAYFEVAHNPGNPFHVKVNNLDVKVLGARLNIKSYSDEIVTKTTLLEGMVSVTKGNKTLALIPGQQAIASNLNNDFAPQNNIDPEQAMAWKNGRFIFNNEDVHTIMREAARWYDVIVIYKGETKETYSGSLSRAADISQFLKIMTATGKVKFEIVNRQVIVTPK